MNSDWTLEPKEELDDDQICPDCGGQLPCFDGCYRADEWQDGK